MYIVISMFGGVVNKLAPIAHVRSFCLLTWFTLNHDLSRRNCHNHCLTGTIKRVFKGVFPTCTSIHVHDTLRQTTFQIVMQADEKKRRSLSSDYKEL